MGYIPLILFSSISFILLLTYFKRKRTSMIKYCSIEKSLRGKIVLITGASAGLGRELTYELARRGAEIVMGCRNLDKANDAVSWINDRLTNTQPELKIHAEDPAKLHVLPLDLSNLTSVESFVHQFNEKFRNLHMLVNNAGIMGGEFATNKGGVELQFAVNHLGHFHLTNLLLNTLQRSQPCRIIIVSSGYYRKAKLADLFDVKNSINYQPLTSYARSKLANCLHGLALSHKLKNDKIGVYVVRPGFVRGTDLGRHFSRLHTSLLFPILWFFSKNLNQGVQTYLHCCLTEHEQLKSGSIFNNCDLDEDFHYHLINDQTADTLLTKSQELVNECLLSEKCEEK